MVASSVSVVAAMTSASPPGPTRRSPKPRAARRRALRRALALAAGLLAADSFLDAEAKTPGAVYCHRDTCHRVISLEETSLLVGRDLKLNASYYDHCRRDRFNRCGLTSSGEIVRPGDPDNAASPIFPDGTALLLFNPDTGRAALVRVNNAGPYWGRRQLDVSRATAQRLGFERDGVADLEVRIVLSPLAADAAYRRHRRYDAVPGFIGSYDSLAHAHAAVLADLERMVEARTPQPRQPSPEEPAIAAARAAREADVTVARALPPLRLAVRAPEVGETASPGRPFDVASLVLPPLVLDRAPPLAHAAGAPTDAGEVDAPPVLTREAAVVTARSTPVPAPFGAIDTGPSWWIDARRTIDVAIAKARTPGAPLRLPKVTIPDKLAAIAELKAQTVALVTALRDGARRGL